MVDLKNLDPETLEEYRRDGEVAILRRKLDLVRQETISHLILWGEDDGIKLNGADEKAYYKALKKMDPNELYNLHEEVSYALTEEILFHTYGEAGYDTEFFKDL